MLRKFIFINDFYVDFFLSVVRFYDRFVISEIKNHFFFAGFVKLRKENIEVISNFLGTG